MEFEQVEVTKLLRVTLDCKLSWSKHVDTTVMLYLLNKTINKAGSTGPSFVAPGLLFSRVVRCHKKGLRKIAIGSELGGNAGPWMYTGELTLIICMSISPGSKWRRDRLHHSLYL